MSLDDRLRALADECEPNWPDGYPFRALDLINLAAALALDDVADNMASFAVGAPRPMIAALRARAAALRGSGR